MAEMTTSNKISPFDFIKAINTKNNHELIEEHEAEYNPFIVNRSFSYFNETLFYANEINRFWGSLDNRLQFDFYYFVIPKRSRFAKWMKSENKEKDDEKMIEAIMSKYRCSRQKALHDYLPCFRLADKEKQKQLKEVMNHGGHTK